MTEQEYRSAPGVNKSTLWEIRKSPMHYQYALNNPSKDTPALLLGRAIHAAVLTPDTYFDEYCVAPEIDRRTNDGKEQYGRFLANHAGQTVLTSDDSILVMALAASIRTDKYAGPLLLGCDTERPIFWTDGATGLPCKCRLDAIKTGGGDVIDLKTCADASPDAFIRDALKYGYDVQAAHYLHGAAAKYGRSPSRRWWFVAMEKTPPYAVNVIRADDGFLDHGEWRRMALMDKLKDCTTKNEWPGYGQTETVLPAWAEIPEEE